MYNKTNAFVANKKIVIGLILVLGLSLSACGKKDDKKVENSPKSGGIEVLEKQSLTDWLKGGKTVECTIKQDGSEVHIISKGENSYVEGVPYLYGEVGEYEEGSNNGVMLTLGDWTYMWDKVTKKGTKMNMREIEEMTGDYDTEEEDEGNDFDSMAEEWEDDETDYDCHEIKEPKNLFEEPKGIEFKDFSEMMGGFMDVSNKVQEQAEAGEEIDMEELEKMMKGMQ